MPNRTEVIPQRWVEAYEPLPDGWLESHAPGLCRVWHAAPETVDRVAREVGVSAKLLVTRMELEQGAVSYAWDGTSRDYTSAEAWAPREVLFSWSDPPDVWMTPDGVRQLPINDRHKLTFLCGADKTDSGPRENGWFGPERQLHACALRFKYWYRGEDGVWHGGDGTSCYKPGCENWLSMAESAKCGFEAGEPVALSDGTLTPSNQASADAMRYTPHKRGCLRLRDIGMRWWPEDYGEEKEGVERFTAVIDPGHNDWTHEFGGGYREGVLARRAGLEVKRLLEAQGHKCLLTRTTPNADPSFYDRAALAPRNGARFFVSLHTNASGSGADQSSASGSYGIFNGRFASETWGPDDEIMSPNGRKLAQCIANEVASAFGLPVYKNSNNGARIWNRKSKTRPKEQAQLGVLSDANNWAITEAACLIEAGYGDNPFDRSKLSAADAPTRYALGVCRGIYRYAGFEIPAEWAVDGEIDTGDTPSTTEPNWSGASVIRQGCSGYWVTLAQGILNASADGDFGPATKAAVVAFQKRNGLDADGIVGPNTWAKLAQAWREQNAAPDEPGVDDVLIWATDHGIGADSLDDTMTLREALEIVIQATA